MNDRTRKKSQQRRARRVEKLQSSRSEAVLPTIRKRIEVMFYALLISLFFLAGRMVQLEAMNTHARLDENDIFVKRQILPAPRGQILAGDGTALAVTLNEYDVAVNPRAVEDKTKLARLLAQTIGGEENEYAQELQKTARADGSKNFYVRLARHVDEARIDGLRSLMRPPKEALRKETRFQRAARKAGLVNAASSRVPPGFSRWAAWSASNASGCA